MCRPIQLGGLGARKLTTLNQTILGKWLWRYGEEKDLLRRQIVRRKYGDSNEQWISSKVHSLYGCSVRTRRIGILWNCFAKFVEFEVVDERSIRLWYDILCGKAALKELLDLVPLLVNLSDDGTYVLDSYICSTISGLRIRNGRYVFKMLSSLSLRL